MTPLEKSFATIRTLKEVSVKRVASLIERNQLSIQNAGTAYGLKDAILQIQLSVYSTSDVKLAEAAAAEEQDKADAQKDKELTEKGKLVREDDSTASTGFKDIKLYFSIATGTTLTAAVCLFFFLVHALRIGSDYWLRLWVPRVGNFSDAVYIGVYGACVALFGLGVLLRGWAFAIISYKKSVTMHNQIFNSVIRAPMSFFDMTPLGHVQSAFTKH